MECKSLIKQQHFSNALELIDTLWNVNVVIQIGTGSVLYRINRYIMECKSALISLSPYRLAELIDTLWNVNGKKNDKYWKEICELIDTLWNVNDEEKRISRKRKRINRYIMECKLNRVKYSILLLMKN